MSPVAMLLDRPARRLIRPRLQCPTARGLFLTATVMAMSMPAVHAQDAALAQQLQLALAKTPHARTKVSACVIDIESGRVVFAHQPDQLLTPASTIKVFVMVAAIEILGPDFAFETRLATDGKNLILIGDGDPALGDPRLAGARREAITAAFDPWAAALLEAGVTDVAGDLIYDASIFDDQLLHPTWEAADLGKWYAAPVKGLNFFDNCVEITISPNAQVGEPVRVSWRPSSAPIDIVNRCVTARPDKPALHHRHDGDRYEISGTCSKQWRFGPVSVSDPGLLTACALRSTLERAGVHIRGEIRSRRVRLSDGGIPPGMAVIRTHRTPIADVLRRIGKNSQNLFAECLLKRLGYAWSLSSGDSDPVGSWASGRRAVEAVLRRTGVDVTGLRLEDGSGLSRHNRCSAGQLAGVLAWMDRHDGADLFRASLSIAGVDGSLKKRLTNTNGRVIGKTGTMKGVRTLAGYVEAESQRRFAFAVMFQGYRGGSAPYKQIQDDISRILIRAAR